jgi:hypothetical protein
MRLAEKTVQTNPDSTADHRKRFGEARSPFDRLCQTGAISQADRDKLLDRRQLDILRM